MSLLPAAMLRLMTAAVRDQGTPRVIPTQRQLKARWATLGRNQQCVSQASAPLLTYSLRSGGRGVTEGTVRSGLKHEGWTDSSFPQDGVLLVLCLCILSVVSVSWVKAWGHGEILNNA